jgi:phospholipase/carboxylesterase
LSLVSRRREPAAEPAGLLVLFHGRATSENDLFSLLDALDPERRLLGVTPRGPLTLPPGGAHWYVVREIGYPDPATFLSSYALAADFLDRLADETGIGPERTIIGGFSQGAVITYSLSLGTGRPRPAGFIALSGFMPTVEGFSLDLSPPLPRAAVGHGTYDNVISVDWSRQARAELVAADADVLYRESPLPHAVDPRFVAELQRWIETTIS